MKQLIAIFLLSTSISGYAQWGKLYTGTFDDLNAVQFVDEKNGFICGENGFIGKTTNGGKNWKDISYSIPFKLFDVFFFDSLYGYVVGENSVLIKTIDGGENWSNSIPLSADTDLNSIDFRDTGNGVVVGTRGKIFKYSKGTWVKEIREDKRDMMAVRMSSYGVNIAVGDSGLILINSNLDSIFKPSSESKTSIPLNSVQFFNDKIYIGGGWYDDSLKDFKSDFYFSEDSGSTFFSNSTKDVETIRRMHHLSEDKIFYLGLGSGLHHTDDLFSTVHRIYAGTNNALNDLFFLNDSVVFSCGVAGTLVKSIHGAGWNTNLLNKYLKNTILYPNPASNTLHWKTEHPVKEVLLYDYSGKLIKTFNSTYKNSIDISKMEKGIYFIKLISREDPFHIKRIVIE